MKTVAITGCSGYIGSCLLEHMEKEGIAERIVGVDIKNPRRSFENLQFYRMDVRDPRISEIFSAHKPERVVHLAFVVNPMRDEKLMHDINVSGTRSILRAALSCNARHITIASSTSAFGAFPDNPAFIKETDQPRRQPNFTYASDKYEVEMMLKVFVRENPKVGLAVVRPCIVYGPNVDNYLSNFLLNLPVLPGVGGARPPMQFIHEDDVARFFLAVLKQQARGCFHAVGEGLVEIEEIAEMARKRIVDVPPFILYPLVDALWRIGAPRIEGPSGMLEFIRYRWVCSDELTRKVLDIPPHMSSSDVVRVTLESKGALKKR